MKKIDNKFIWTILSITILLYSANFSNAATNQDDWGVKEGDKFNYNYKIYDEGSSYDCSGVITYSIVSINNDGALTYNSTVTKSCESGSLSSSLSNLNVNYSTPSKAGIRLNIQSVVQMYILFSIPSLEGQAEIFENFITSRINYYSTEEAQGDFSGSYSGSWDSLGYSNTIDGTIDSGNIKTQHTLRYQSNGILEKYEYSGVVRNIEWEIVFTLENSNDIPGPAINILLAVTLISVFGIANRIRLKPRKKINL